MCIKKPPQRFKFFFVAFCSTDASTTFLKSILANVIFNLNPVSEALNYMGLGQIPIMCK